MDVYFGLIIDGKMTNKIFAEKPQTLFFAAIFHALFFIWRDMVRNFFPLRGL